MAEGIKPKVSLKFGNSENRMPAAMIFWPVLAVLIFFGCTSPATRNSDNEVSVRRIVEDLRPNVVRVIASPDSEQEKCGFGIIVGEIWRADTREIIIATAKHILPNMKSPGDQKVSVVFFQCMEHGPIEASPKFVKDSADLAILFVNAKGCNNVSHFGNYRSAASPWREDRFSSPVKAESVWFIGRHQQWEIPQYGTIGQIDNRTHKMTVNIGSVWNGSSGAPLINRHGKIVGMIQEDKTAKTIEALSEVKMRYLIEKVWNLPYGTVIGDDPPLPEPSQVVCDPEDGPVQAGTIRNKFGMRFILVKADNSRIVPSSDFYIQSTEVTQCQWMAVTGKPDNPAHFANCGEHCPVEKVSWKRVEIFIDKLNSQDNNHQYSLPTEDQWEHVCRMSMVSTQKLKCRRNATSTVTSISPASLDGNQIHGLLGNVREWCLDEFRDAPSPTNGRLRAVRGGGWRSLSEFCRCDARDGVHEAKVRSASLGFRLVLRPKTHMDE